MRPALQRGVSTSVFRPRIPAWLFSTPTLASGLFVLSIVAGLMGQATAFGPKGIALVSFPPGLALGAFLFLGYRIWPVVAAADIVVMASAYGFDPVLPSLVAGHTAEPLLAAYLVNRYASGRHALLDPRNSVRFAGVVALAATVSASVTAVSLLVAGHVAVSDYGVAFLAQALGSTTGTLLAAPPVALFSRGRPRPRLEQVPEACAAFVAVAATGLIGFYRFPFELRGFPVELMLMPVLVWPALRLGRRATAIALLVLAPMVVAGTLAGYGPFVRATPFASLVIVQLFLSLSAVLTFSLSALSSGYEAAEAQLRELVVTDPLTGLPNYRKLLEVLEQEIDRANRLSREFAVVFFDMDDLKRINDELGHLTGSRAVSRFADTLRGALRDADTAARYGGDEFVAVLPDTSDDGAALVVSRTHEQLSADTIQPRLAVSAGVAIYPRDGRTPTTLLSAADRALYATKAQKARARPRNLVDLHTWTSAS